MISKTSSEHAGQSDKAGTRRVFSRIEVMPPGSICTESYLVIGPFSSKAQAQRVASYLRTRFVRYLVSTILLTQNVTKSMFEFVPLLDFSKEWLDQDLFQKFNLTIEEQGLISSSIKSMEIE